MRLSLRTLAIGVVLLCIALTLIVIASPTAALLSDAAAAFAVLLGVCGAIGATQPHTSFWLALASVILLLNTLLSPQPPIFEKVKVVVDKAIARPLYQVLHERKIADLEGGPYKSGESSVFVGGTAYHGAPIQYVPVKEENVPLVGVDIETLPFIAAYADFRRILVDIISLAGGLAGGWLAWTLRCRSMLAKVPD